MNHQFNSSGHILAPCYYYTYQSWIKILLSDNIRRRKCCGQYDSQYG